MRKHWFVALVLCERLAESSSLSNPNLPIDSAVNNPLAKDRIQSTATTGLYVHIPFCRRRCRYCDFAIVPIGNTLPTSLQDDDDDDSLSQCQQHKKENILFDSYQTAIIKEIHSLERTASQANNISKRKVVLDTIYFGGGTPSLAPLSMLQGIVNAIQATFDLADSLEFTMECDPGTFDREKLQGFKSLGVNRISLGVQSFDDKVLEYLGRFHRKIDIDRALQDLQAVYGADCHYTLDLIASLPGITLADWCTTLHSATQLQPTPQHLSVYDLSIEDSTVFGKWYDGNNQNVELRQLDKAGGGFTAGSIRPLPTPSESAFQYQYTAGYLRAAGYEHYEISSYAQPGFRSRHNSLYWGYNSTWYATGLGATSWVQGKLNARPRAMSDYIQWVNDGQPDFSENIDDTDEPNSLIDRLQNLVMTRLRTSEGLDLDLVGQQYGSSCVDAIFKGACLDDLKELVVYEAPTLRLIDSKGFMFSNSILSSIFLALDEVEA